MPGIPNADNNLVRVSGGEFIATRQQQARLVELADGGTPGGSEELVESINRLAERPINVEIDGKAVARAVRSEVRLGFQVA